MADISGGVITGVITREGEEYVVVPLLHDWVRVTHPSCGARVKVAQPTEAKLDLYVERHDCNAREWMPAL